MKDEEDEVSAPPVLAGGEGVDVRLVKSAAGLGLDIGVFCEIVSVAAGSQAEGADVAEGDVIVGVNGAPVDDQNALVDVIGAVSV